MFCEARQLRRPLCFFSVFFGSALVERSVPLKAESWPDVHHHSHGYSLRVQRSAPSIASWSESGAVGVTCKRLDYMHPCFVCLAYHGSNDCRLSGEGVHISHLCPSPSCGYPWVCWTSSSVENDHSATQCVEHAFYPADYITSSESLVVSQLPLGVSRSCKPGCLTRHGRASDGTDGTAPITHSFVSRQGAWMLRSYPLALAGADPPLSVLYRAPPSLVMAASQGSWTTIDDNDTSISYTPSIRASNQPWNCRLPTAPGPKNPCLNEWYISC